MIVAVSMVALVGAAAFAVDLGGTWASQRRLHTATDAAALAAAQAYAAVPSEDGCGATDDEYVTNNDDDASVTGCQRVGTDAAGYVTVSATRPVDFHFAQIFGIDSTDVESSTTAAYGSPLSVTGLRPIAICDKYPALLDWLDAPNGPTGPSAEITIPQTNNDVGCDNAPGNWGWLDLDGENGGGANQLSDDLRFGSEETVVIPGLLEPKPGNVASTADDLQYLVVNDIEFPIPLFDLVDGQGNNARFHAVGVVTVKLTAFTSDSFTFIFTPKTIEGTCCSEGGPDTGTKVVNICAVDDDFDVSRCQP